MLPVVRKHLLALAVGGTVQVVVAAATMLHSSSVRRRTHVGWPPPASFIPQHVRPAPLYTCQQIRRSKSISSNTFQHPPLARSYDREVPSHVLIISIQKKHMLNSELR